MNATAAEFRPSELLAQIRTLEKAHDWKTIAALRDRLPAELDLASLPLADAITFALGQLHRTDEAIALMLQVWAIEPSYRRAAVLAYLHYAASLELCSPGRSKGKHSESLADRREKLRAGFRSWIAEALARASCPIKELYRLGIFEAQVESFHDKPALRAFLGVMRAYRALPEVERARRHDFTKYVARAFYAGGRSALRLGENKLARKLSFECIRFDRDTDHVAPVHKLSLAGKACLATGELDVADRAFRLALDAKGPQRRDFIHGFISEVIRRKGDPSAAATWLDRHVPVARRSSSLWRQLGVLRAEAGDTRGAEAALRAALPRDRGGRHITLNRLGDLLRERGDLRGAERCYRDAVDFRRRRWASEDPYATEQLEALASLKKGPPIAKTGERHAPLEPDSAASAQKVGAA